MEEKSIIYSPEAVGFVKIASDVCQFLEQVSEMEAKPFVSSLVKMLPLLYLKATVVNGDMLEHVEGFNEKFVTENDYIFISSKIATLLGENDVFLETFHPDMPYSDTPIATFISENVADIYQEIKDMVENYKIGEVIVLETALKECIDAFAEHWGQKLLNSLRALHLLLYSEKELEYNDNEF